MKIKKIIIIEDDYNLQEMYKLIFSIYSNIELFNASNGYRGIELIKTIKPDLIILDNKMPKLPGEQVAKLLRADPKTKDIPIIMTTAMKLTEEEIKLIKLDVNELFLKPCSTEILVSVMEKYIGKLIKASED